MKNSTSNQAADTSANSTHSNTIILKLDNVDPHALKASIKAAFQSLVTSNEFVQKPEPEQEKVRSHSLAIMAAIDATKDEPEPEEIIPIQAIIDGYDYVEGLRNKLEAFKELNKMDTDEYHNQDIEKRKEIEKEYNRMSKDCDIKNKEYLELIRESRRRTEAAEKIENRKKDIIKNPPESINPFEIINSIIEYKTIDSIVILEDIFCGFSLTENFINATDRYKEDIVFVYQLLQKTLRKIREYENQINSNS